MYGGFSHVPERLWGKYGIKNETEAKEPKNIQPGARMSTPVQYLTWRKNFRFKRFYP
jgi:hypothetical protein